MPFQSYISTKPLIGIEILNKISFQVGRIKAVTPLTKAKKPSYEFCSDFGENVSKKSCGQFVRNYKIDDLMNKQIFALTNLNPIRIAGIKSEYLTLGFSDEKKDGQAIAITPVDEVENGLRFSLKTEKPKDLCNNQLIDYEVFDSLEVKSATVIDIITSKKTHRSLFVVHFGDNIYDLALVPGILGGDKAKYLNIQIPVITNVKIIDDEYAFEITKVVFTMPIHENRQVTIMKIDKKVENNLPMF